MAAINNRRESNFLIKSVKGFDEKFEPRGDFTGNRNVTGCSFSVISTEESGIVRLIDLPVTMKLRGTW